MRVHATDNVSGVYTVSARFRLAIVSNGVTQYLTPEIVTSAFAGRAGLAAAHLTSSFKLA